MAEETVKDAARQEEEAVEAAPADAAAGETAASSPQDADKQIGLLEAEVRSVAEERDRYRDALVHERADFENYKKRNAALGRESYARGTEDAVLGILPVIDNFERALNASAESEKFAEGMEMIMRQLQDVISGLGVTEIDTSGTFDPMVHHAVMQTEEADVPSNQIVETLQKGYRIGDKVVRPAMVKVNR